MSEPLTITTATNFFLDKPAVKNAESRMNRRSLSKIGGGLRIRARRLMRPGGKKRKRSQPGEAPRTQRGDLKKFLYYVYSPETESVVVGPVGFPRRSTGAKRPVPGMLEEGGQVKLELVKLAGGLEVPAASKLGRMSGGRRITRPATIEPRPYMQPAHEAEKPRYAGSFQGEFRNN